MLTDIKEDLPWPGEFNRTYQPGLEKIKETLLLPQDKNWLSYFLRFKKYLNALDKIKQTNFLNTYFCFF